MGFNITDIRADARYFVSPQITSTEYSDITLDRNANRWYQKVLSWVLPVQGEWEMNGDILTKDFEANVTKYFVPAAILRIFKCEVMYSTASGFVATTPLSVQREQSLVEGNISRTIDSVENPTRELIGNILEIKPAPQTTVVNGIKIWAQLSFDDINATNNKLPNLPEPVKRVISLGAAHDYCVGQEMWTKVHEIRKQIYGDNTVKNDEGLKGEIEELFANKAGDRRDGFRANRRTSFR